MPSRRGSVKQTKTAGSTTRPPFQVDQLDRVGLLFRHISNYRQLEHLVLIRLQQQNDPKDETSDSEYQMQRCSYQNHEGDDRQDRQCDAEGDHGYAEEDTLE